MKQCCNCSKFALPGKSRCARCIEMRSMWEQRHRSRIVLQKREAGRRHSRKVKFAVIEAYGGKCECCGESNKWFLTIDHLDRSTFPKSPRTGKDLYWWLCKRGFPSGVRLLCYNCNCSKGFLGECPHVTEPPGRWIRPALGLMKKQYPKTYEYFLRKAKGGRQ